MTPQTPESSVQERPRHIQDEDAPVSSSTSPAPTVNQRIGLAVISLAFLVLLVNIMAYLSSSFGPTGSAIGLAAICLVILGVNVVFNLDAFRTRR